MQAAELLLGPAQLRRARVALQEVLKLLLPAPCTHRPLLLPSVPAAALINTAAGPTECRQAYTSCPALASFSGMPTWCSRASIQEAVLLQGAGRNAD